MPSETPGWEISLNWSQKIAAYWSISWPAFIGLFFIVIFLPLRSSLSDLKLHSYAISLLYNAIFFCLQVFLIRRLIRKNYRSFRIYVIRDGSRRSRSLPFGEIGMVWLSIITPQIALIITFSLIGFLFGHMLDAQALQTLNSLGLWLRYLVVGPYSIGFATQMTFPKFRLQAYGLRRVW